VFTKRSLIILLAIVNTVLLLGLVVSSSRLPQAFAQAGVRPGSYLSVTANADGQSYDTVWVVDLAHDKLFAFYPQVPHLRPLVSAEPRDLVADFGKSSP